MLLCSHFSVQAELLCLDSFVPGLGPEPSSEFDLGAHCVCSQGSCFHGSWSEWWCPAAAYGFPLTLGTGIQLQEPRGRRPMRYLQEPECLAQLVCLGIAQGYIS